MGNIQPDIHELNLRINDSVREQQYGYNRSDIHIHHTEALPLQIKLRGVLLTTHTNYYFLLNRPAQSNTEEGLMKDKDMILSIRTCIRA